MYEKHSAEAFKNLARCRPQNNFVGSSKWLYRMFERWW